MLPVRSYSIRNKRKNREAIASLRKNQARRKVTSGTTATHTPARRTVSAGSTLPSENKPPRSPSAKSVSSEPGATTSKDLKFETLIEEEQEDKEDETEEKKEEKKEEDGEEGDKVKDKEETSVEKAHVTFDETKDAEVEEPK
nr:pescadillo homolog [Parasteatoda tepidariorum]